MKLQPVRLLRIGQITMSLAGLAILCLATYQTVFYLRTAARFEVQKLSVSGARRVPETEVIAQAGFAAGTNIFRVNLDDMRARVEELAWVRFAAVQRILPDQIVIRIVEREPIGLTRIKGEIYQFDIDGKILTPDPASGSSFPILDGMRAGDRKNNARKVQMYRTVLEALDQTSLSEIHINDSGEVAVVSANDPVLINLGGSDFRSRWIRYLQLKPQILQQYPETVRVDLRFKNQVIIKMKDDEAGEKIVWGTKKNTL